MTGRGSGRPADWLPLSFIVSTLFPVNLSHLVVSLNGNIPECVFLTLECVFSPNFLPLRFITVTNSEAPDWHMGSAGVVGLLSHPTGIMRLSRCRASAALLRFFTWKHTSVHTHIPTHYYLCENIHTHMTPAPYSDPTLLGQNDKKMSSLC